MRFFKMSFTENMGEWQEGKGNVSGKRQLFGQEMFLYLAHSVAG